MPGVYNPTRLSERPLPLLVLDPNNEQQQSDDELSIAENEQQQQPQPDDERSIAEDEQQQAQFDDDRSIAECQPPLNSGNLNISTVSITEEPANDSHRCDGEEEITHNSSIDPLANDLVDEMNMQINNGQLVIATEQTSDDGAQSNNEQQELCGVQQSVETSPNQNEPVDEINTATEQLIATDDAIPTTSNNDESAAIASIKPEPAFVPLHEESAQAVDDVLNESFELCDDSGDIMVHSKSAESMPMPIAERNPYEIKQRDVISGNLPFATNVSILNDFESI